MALNLLNKNSKFLDYLDWQEILTALVSQSYFNYTKEGINNLLEFRPISIINQELNFIELYLLERENYNHALNNVFITLPSTNELETYLKSIEKGIVLELNQLNTICKLLENYPAIFRTFDHFNIEHNHPDQALRSKIRNKFIREFRNLVSQNGETQLEKHPKLSKLFKEVRDLETDLRISISKIKREESYSKALQYNEHDIINDRYVLAVRSDSYNSKMGVIVAKSSTGMTLFIEPYSLRDKSNRRMRIMAQIDAIINEICQNFCETLLLFERAPLNILHYYYKLDLIKAKSSYSYDLQLCRPILNQDNKVNIKDFFHPLIENPVLNDLHLDSTSKGLVISGPNTGGKTVTLKSVSLCFLMSYMGLYVPARSCEIYLPQGIYYFSHDQQDLTTGLSSFASEAKNYLELLKDIEPNSLIIVDEIFNSTSSEEASALAISFLQEIHKRSDAKVIISTHHQFFKTYIHSSKEYTSCHVGFDQETSMPTYKLLFGSPGSSMAFQIFDILATRFGLSNNISESAEQILDKKQLSYEQLLQELSHKKSELDRHLMENRQLNNSLKNQKQSMEGLVHLEKERLIKEYKKKLNKIISKAENLLSETRKGKIDSKKQLAKKVSAISGSLPDPKKRKFTEILEDVQITANITIDDIREGDLLFSPTFNRDVKVMAINHRKKEVQVINGKMSIWMKLDKLTSAKIKYPKQNVQINITRSVYGKLEIDGRGMRLEEFQKLVEDSVHELIAGDIPFLNIIHGHGEGTLKKWLRVYLKDNRELTWIPEDGNDGATRVTIEG
ncbi:hypothetical protein A9Q84_21290 [Halobacteriovorax marinus]|uniref:Smr domain-containing protein n=1 Tax=Halobacteriovorax marinus TaxID=97084 RepID=A0A1Y5F7E6_9BACT|nr:hypothetical protein A9Q84_21290 [Halobacteriovorax marinus]